MIDLIREANRIHAQMVRAQDMDLPATLTLEEWVAIINQFNGLCAYCQEVSFDAMDHLIPIASGGGTIAENCIPACLTCNSCKAGRILCDTSEQTPLATKLEQVRYVLQNKVRIPKPKVNQEIKQVEAKPEDKVTVRFLLGMLNDLKSLASKHKRSLNNEIVWALESYVERQAKQ